MIGTGHNYVGGDSKTALHNNLHYSTNINQDNKQRDTRYGRKCTVSMEWTIYAHTFISVKPKIKIYFSKI
jgi:hypothetical protein